MHLAATCISNICTRIRFVNILLFVVGRRAVVLFLYDKPNGRAGPATYYKL